MNRVHFCQSIPPPILSSLEVDSDQSEACFDDLEASWRTIGWDGWMIIIVHRSKSTFGANNCLCFSPHENVIIFSRTMFYVISFVRGPQKDRLFPFISFPFSHSIFGFLVFSRENTNMHHFYRTQVRLFSTYEAVSDQGPVWVQSEDKIRRASTSNFELEILISLVSLLP